MDILLLNRNMAGDMFNNSVMYVRSGFIFHMSSLKLFEVWLDVIYSTFPACSHSEIDLDDVLHIFMAGLI